LFIHFWLLTLHKFDSCQQNLLDHQLKTNDSNSSHFLAKNSRKQWRAGWDLNPHHSGDITRILPSFLVKKVR